MMMTRTKDRQTNKTKQNIAEQSKQMNRQAMCLADRHTDARMDGWSLTDVQL